MTRLDESDSKRGGILTNDCEREICKPKQRRLLLRRQLDEAHAPQLGATRNGAHKREARKHKGGELDKDGGAAPAGRRQAPDEVDGEGELDEELDPEEGLEPGGVGRRGGRDAEEGVAGVADVQAPDGDEEVQRRGGPGVEELGVEGDEVKD